MRTVKLSRKEFRERFGEYDAFTERMKGEESIIYLPGRASTKERLHEIYHASESPSLKDIEAGKKWYSPDEHAYEELCAQGYAAEMVSKEGLPWNMIESVAWSLAKQGYKPATIMGSITRALEKEGYEPLDREQRNILWEDIKEMYDRGYGR